MFKKNSRVLSVLLSLVLVFGTMCVPAFATDAAAVNDAVVASVETYEIYSAQDLVDLQNEVSALSAGSSNAPSVVEYNVVLKNNIDMTNVSWSGIGVPQQFKGFSGTFDGQGYTISGINITNTSNAGPKGALFNLTYNATVKDLTVTGSVTSNRFIGGITGRAMGNLTIESCTTSGLSLTLNNGASNSVGGLVGQCGSGSGGGGGTGTGGTSGSTQGTVNITGCNVGGTFTSNTASNPVGGMLGHVYAGYSVTISNSTVAASLNGSIKGAYVGNNAGTITITGCENSTGVSANAGTNTGTIN